MAAYLFVGGGGVWNDRVCERGFPVYGCLPACGRLVNGDIKFIMFSDSVSAVNLSLGCTVLKSSSIFWVSVWSES